MTHQIPSITRILIARSQPIAPDDIRFLSIGLAIDNGEVFWGDYPYQSLSMGQIATIERLTDLCQEKLQGQYVSDFKSLWSAIEQIFPPQGIVREADGTKVAVQQGILYAVVAAHQSTIAEYLPREYDLQPVHLEDYKCPVIIEIRDSVATVSRIDHMLRLKPAGIGYRVTGKGFDYSLGKDGEYLQQFVAELSQRIHQVGGQAGDKTIIYLALNGGPGALAKDQTSNIGKALAICVNLQEAAGPHSLVLEDPLQPDESFSYSTNLLRLKEFIRRTPTSLDRAAPTQLVANGSILASDELNAVITAGGAHSLAFDFDSIRDLNVLLTRVGGARSAGMGVFLHVSDSITSRWVDTIAGIAGACQMKGVVVDFDKVNDSLYLQLERSLVESTAHIAHKNRTPKII